MTLSHNLANENNLAETAFIQPDVGKGDSFHKYLIRWFTPITEVELCGHAT